MGYLKLIPALEVPETSPASGAQGGDVTTLASDSIEGQALSRRQFDFWTTAALLSMPALGCGTSQPAAQDVAPQEASGMEQQALVQSHTAAQPVGALRGLAALVVTPKFSESEGPGFDLEVLNRARRGTTVRIDVESVYARVGDQVVPVIGWLNDNNPLSRRIMEPSFVDLPAGKTIVAGRVNLMPDEEWMNREGVMISVKLRVSGTRNRSRVIDLPPISLRSAMEGQS